ncbi:MAG: MATE family efflux transporter [Verrucomicrobiota bacterium]
MSILRETGGTLRLAVPLMIGNVSQMLLGLADTLMVGKLGVAQLAALTFANAVFHIPFIFGMGILSAIAVLSSNARGAGDPAAARASCRHGLYLAATLGLLLLVVFLLISPHLHRFGQPPEIVKLSRPFLTIIMASLIPALLAIALKNHADALNRPWPPFWIFLGGVGLNIFLNWVMIYGKFGVPALGMTGAAWATFISRWVIVAAMLVWMLGSRDLTEWIPKRWLAMPVTKEITRLLAIGFPASIHMVFEVGAFSMSGFLMGRFGEVPMAAHQIALTLAGTSFMVPLGLSMALTVRAGEAFGAGNHARLRPIILSGWILCAGYALLAALFFVTLGETISAGFTNSAAVIALASSMLTIVGVFQLVDALQVASSAILRGIHDTRFPAWMGFISYWIIGIPAGALLGFHFVMGARGVWWGLAIGLAVACLTIGARVWLQTNPARTHPGN